MELKYCEHCGNIWLRHTGSRLTQCAPCARAEAPAPTGAPVSFLQLWSRFRAEAQA
jgi:hypothetical protein